MTKGVKAPSFVILFLKVYLKVYLKVFFAILFLKVYKEHRFVCWDWII